VANEPSAPEMWAQRRNLPHPPRRCPEWVAAQPAYVVFDYFADVVMTDGHTRTSCSIPVPASRSCCGPS
jgi:hypothetical protein